MKVSQRNKREAAQLFQLCFTNGLLDETRALQVLKQVVETKPRGYLQTLSHFRRLVQLEQARHTAHVESATPLPADFQIRLREQLARIYGQGLSVVFSQNPALIGGLRIQVGSDVYNGSIQGRLAALERSLDAGATN